MKTLSVALACAFALISASCVDQDDIDIDDETTPLADDVVVTDTVATLGPDGEVVTSTARTITVGEQRAQNEARLSGAPPASSFIEQDFACQYDSLWVYSRTDYTGDRLCLRGYYSYFYMEDYTRWTVFNGHWHYAGTWQIPRGSFLVGAQGGTIYAPNPVTTYSDVKTFTTSSYAGTFAFPNPIYAIVLY